MAVEYDPFKGEYTTKTDVVKKALKDYTDKQNDISTYDYINPKHYTSGAHECIDVMEAMFGTYATMDFCKLSIFKYRFRAGLKPGEVAERDIKKAEWYETKLMELNEKAKTHKEILRY